MNTLTIYGKKGGGDEKIIFRNVAKGCLKTAEKTAAEHGYTITRIIENGVFFTEYGLTMERRIY